MSEKIMLYQKDDCFTRVRKMFEAAGLHERGMLVGPCAEVLSKYMSMDKDEFSKNRENT